MEMERLQSQKSLGIEGANSGAREREMNRQASSQKSMERMVSHRATQMVGALVFCKALLLGFLCGVGVTYLLLLAGGMSFKGTSSLFTFDVMSVPSFHQPISAGHHKDRIGKNETLQGAQSSGTSFGILHFC